jgi:hypothetical protein
MMDVVQNYVEMDGEERRIKTEYILSKSEAPTMS